MLCLAAKLGIVLNCSYQKLLYQARYLLFAELLVTLIVSSCMKPLVRYYAIAVLRCTYKSGIGMKTKDTFSW